MLKLYLSYNRLLEDYILFSGKDWDHRHVVTNFRKEDGLVKKLKQNIDIDRKSILSFDNVPEEILLKVDVAFKNTKVKVIYEE